MGLLLLLLALPLAAGAVEMFMDLRTDYAPTTQFTTVRVQVIDTVDNRKSWHQITGVRGTDPAAGMRIGRFDHIESGRRYYVQIELLDSRMRPVDGRLLSLIGPRDRRVITTVISRR